MRHLSSAGVSVSELVLVLVLALIFLGAATSSGPSTSRHDAVVPRVGESDAEGYRMVWADEFNVDGPPDPKNWIFEHGLVRNHEAQWYQSDNATCRDGKLIIEARRETKPNPDYVEGSREWQRARKESQYTSAAIETRGKHSWKYGRFILRARIDVRAGSWPAFWMMGEHGGWPACGEVDVMEYYKDVLLANVGWKGNGPNGTSWNTGKKPLKDLPPDWSEKFHTWRMDWDEKSISLYCDDQLLNTQDLSKALNPNGTCPFHQPAYLLINQAIGGDCGGDPSKTQFPVRYEVDYVRVYQKPSAAASH